MENSDTTHDTTSTARPLGFWLRVVDGLLAREVAESLDDAAVSRRDAMLLHALDGRIDAPWLAEKLARKSGRVRRLADRGWIVQTDGTWTLTEEGRAEKERLSGLVDGIRGRVAAAVSPEDYATTLASLEAIARELGWDEKAHAGRRHHGFGPRGFGGRHGFGPGGRGRGFGSGHDHGHGRGHDERGEHAYERGFTAGFERGRAAPSAPAA